ncbi:hypothetical protein [Nocardia sp. AG03]|uniref:hypothetical protein n=1 Tax=Nocardia sp. AG03 TaxID=3025312 RepID=UPI0024183E0E|nr:hypothetical protein [Nocardia sp. AG03]
MSKILNSLSDDEYVLVRKTKKSQMAKLDENHLIELHSRIRRARNKYVKLYRREGAAKVESKGARGSGKAANKRNAARAEVFEDALSRVSRRLAKVAEKSAERLKEQRLTSARKDAPSFSDLDSTDGKVDSPGRPRVDPTRQSPGRKKYEASTIAAGARRQAAKDNK